jgi:3-mercaptopyruvate sulfurtransferase SseA
MTQNRKSILPIILIVFGGLLVLGTATWYIYTNASRPDLALVPTAVVEGAYPEIPRISVQDAKAAYDIGNAIFVDVRDPESYAQSHIVGAISIPLQDLPNRIQELDPQAWIITYCT